MAPIQRPQPDARSVVEPQPTSLRLPLRHLQPLLPPDPLHPLVLHPPALDAEHVRDASVAVAAESTRESHDITSERPPGGNRVHTGLVEAFHERQELIGRRERRGAAMAQLTH